MVISKTFRFEASHILPRHPGKCSRLHGHSWVFGASVEGPVNSASGMVCDFYALSKVVNEHVVERLDHTHLGYGRMEYQILAADGGIARGPKFEPYLGKDFYPTSENLATAIAHILTPFIKELGNEVQLHSIRIEETCTSAAIWTPAAIHPRGV